MVDSHPHLYHPGGSCPGLHEQFVKDISLLSGVYLLHHIPKVWNYQDFETPERLSQAASCCCWDPPFLPHKNRWSRGLSSANAYQGDLMAALAAEDQLMEHTVALQDLNDVLTWWVLEGGWFAVLVNLLWLSLSLLWLCTFGFWHCLNILNRMVDL